MVYYGQISRSCFRCRKRKLRCDLREPSCGACLRAKVSCTGYRDAQQLQIRDESWSTERKALLRQTKSIHHAPVIPIHERARNAFFFRYVSGFSNSYDVLEPLYTQSSVESHLVVSVDAVGLAFLTFQSSYSQVPQAARAKYLDALSLLKHELVSPSSSLSDATLLTVLLLDLFEKINGNNPQSTEGWMSHVDGALALMRLRGQENVRNHTALRLSMRLSTNLIISSLAANHRVPLEVIRLRAEVEPFINADDPKWRLSGLTVKYANLRGSMQEGSLSDADILTQSKDLDMEFVLLAKSVPPSWMYQSVYPAKVSERFFESHYDTYRDHLVTQTWNVLRAMRIFLNDTLRTSSQRNSAAFCELDPNIPSEEYSSAIIDTMAKEICATTAQYTTCTEAKSKSIEIPAVETLRCYTIIFPLYTAGLYASEQTGIKPWVVKELRFMGNGIGIRNANLVADVLERGDGTSPWSVYAMTGSYAFAA